MIFVLYDKCITFAQQLYPTLYSSITMNAILVRSLTFINPIVIADIDLTDPAVEAAATKIQSAFKGFKIRKNISKQ